MPSFWVKPLTTNLALCLSIEPSEWNLVLNTHLQDIAFLPFGKGTKDHVLLLSKAENSLAIASCHSGWTMASS